MPRTGKQQGKKQKITRAQATHKVAHRASNVQTSAPDSGTRVLFYLSISDMSQVAKEAWASLLPYMSDGQRERLATILEASFLDAATRGIDEHLAQELNRINAQYAHAAS